MGKDEDVHDSGVKFERKRLKNKLLMEIERIEKQLHGSNFEVERIRMLGSLMSLRSMLYWVE